MKLFLVSVLLAAGLLILIILLDMLMGVDPSKVVWKAINPFRVIEPAEMVIILIFVSVFLIDSFITYRKQKKAPKKQS